MRPVTILCTLVCPTACAKPRDSRIDPSGPYPAVGTGKVMWEEIGNGVLVVYTPKVRVDIEGRLYYLPHDSDWGSSHSVHTGYSIYDPSGRLIREVRNHSPLVVSDEGPTQVDLPAGRYLLRLDRTEGEDRAFWVTIEARRRTQVDPARFVLDWPGRVVGSELS